MAKKTNKKSFLINAQWTAMEAVKGWRHYRIVGIFYSDGNKMIQLRSVCDAKVSIEESVLELKSNPKWLPGWR